MVRVLVLGGAGFIGYHLVQHLVTNGNNRTTIVDNLSRGKLDRELGELLKSQPQLEFLNGDLSTPDTFKRISGTFDSVYLLAGMIGARNVQTHPAEVIRRNTSIILNTLDWVRRVGCGRLLFASTSEVYAGSVELGIAGIPTPEDVPLATLNIQHPRSSYAITKMLGEAAVTHYAQEHKFEAVIVRYHNIYGPRMGFDHVIPELMQRISRGLDPLPVYGLEQTRAFCYITDAVRATHALMQCKLNSTEIVHVGNDEEEISIRELLDKLLSLTGAHPTIEALPSLEGAVSKRCPDISKLRALTKFEPQVGIDQGLALTWQWYR